MNSSKQSLSTNNNQSTKGGEVMEIKGHRYSYVNEISSTYIPNDIIIKEFGSLNNFEELLKNDDEEVIDFIQEGDYERRVTHLQDIGEVDLEYCSKTYPKWRGELVDEFYYDDECAIQNLWKNTTIIQKNKNGEPY